MRSSYGLVVTLLGSLKVFNNEFLMLFIFRFVWCLPNSSHKITITKVRIFFPSKRIHYYFAQWVGYKHELLQSVCKEEGCLATSWPNYKGLVYINNYNLLQGSHLLDLTVHRGSCLHLRHIIDSFQTLLSFRVGDEHGREHNEHKCARFLIPFKLCMFDVPTNVWRLCLFI